jgi:hypothetical protein
MRPPPPELQQRLEAYVGLIEQLVLCPAGEEPSVLQAHQDLLDLPFLQLLGAVAEQAYQQEETRPIGEFLGQIGIQLQGAFGQALQERLAAYQQLVAAGMMLLGAVSGLIRFRSRCVPLVLLR